MQGSVISFKWSTCVEWYLWRRCRLERQRRSLASDDQIKHWQCLFVTHLTALTCGTHKNCKAYAAMPALACTGKVAAVDALQAQDVLRVPQGHAHMIFACVTNSVCNLASCHSESPMSMCHKGIRCGLHSGLHTSAALQPSLDVCFERCPSNEVHP